MASRHAVYIILAHGDAVLCQTATVVETKSWGEKSPPSAVKEIGQKTILYFPLLQKSKSLVLGKK